MPLTRRQFITRTGLATAGGLLGPSFLNNLFVQRALADVLSDKYLVILYLDGGNDGLNTITPYDNGNGGGTLRTDYDGARSNGVGDILLAPGDLLVPISPAPPMLDPNTGAQLGFHPGLAMLKSLYDQGKVAVIQGCGYPVRPDQLSHDFSKNTWRTGDPFGANLGTPLGWMGRCLIAGGFGSGDFSSVNTGGHVAGEFRQYSTNVLAINKLSNFSFPYDSYRTSDKPWSQAAYSSLHTDAGGTQQAAIEYIGDTGKAMLTASQVFPLLHNYYKNARPSFDAEYSALNTSTASDLREVAKVIYGVESHFNPQTVYARYFEVTNGGYDTHSNQGDNLGAQNNLHREVGNALEVFYRDCASMGMADRLCVVVWSEFSRRVSVNSDNGTDHGTQGPMFVVGGTVNGGVYGFHPNIRSTALSQGNTVYSQNPGNGFRSTDFRDVFGTIVKQWLGIADPTTILPLDTGSANSKWTLPNFKMGFLPTVIP